MSTAKVIAAGCSALVAILGGAIWIIAVGPIFNQMFPLIMENTPLNWFVFLHGDVMIPWIVRMVYVIIVLGAVFACAGIVLSAFKEVNYDTDKW